MNSAVLSVLAALAGSTIGAISSIATTWLTQIYQSRTQRVSQGISQREHLFCDFITLASKLYADALTREAPDPPTLVPLYALKAQMSLFAAKATVDGADEVMRRIVDTYYKPGRDFRTRQALEDGEYDLLLDFTFSAARSLRQTYLAARSPGIQPDPDVASPRREHAMMVSVKHNLPWCPHCQSKHVKLGSGTSAASNSLS